MNLDTLLKDKATKSKEKVAILSRQILKGSIALDEVITTARKGKDAEKGTCIEALELATKQHPAIASEALLEFVTETLTEKAPRVKWESAKVIGNIAALFPDKLEKAIGFLIANSEHEGTVVRWSAAFALGEILKLKSTLHTELAAALEAISAREEKNSIKKIYHDALKKLKK